MNRDQVLIDLSTRLQRQRDFTAHLTGFVVGATALLAVHLVGVNGDAQFVTTLLVWATALSFQHFRHVLRGPVTIRDLIQHRPECQA